MNDWTETLRRAIANSERHGETPERGAYIDAGLPVPEKATDEYQQAPLWRRIINFFEPVW